jgi:hypothetical protein
MQRGERVRQHQGLQEFEARIVGEVEVVDDDGVQADSDRVDQRGVDRTVQGEPLRLPGESDGGAELRQDEGELLGAGGAQRDRVLGEQGTQQAGQPGVGDARVAGAGAHADDARVAGRELVQQAALADSRLADDQEAAARRPGVIECGELALAADEARRPHQARGNDGAPCRQRRAAALDRRQQLDRLGRRRRPLLVLEALLEALEGGDRRRAVAAQIVQPHDATLRMLAQRIALDQPLRVDETARDRSIVLARRCRRRQRGVASGVPVLALGVDPRREVGKVVEVEIAEQLGSARRGRRRGFSPAS